MIMAETLPPDRNKSAGKNRGGKSGKVADFRYQRPPQPDARASGGNGRSKGANGDGRRAGRGKTTPANPASSARPDLADIGAMKPSSHGEA